MGKRNPEARARTAAACALALAVAVAGTASPLAARADTGGDTELTVRRADSEEARAGDAPAGKADGQSRLAVAGQGGGTPQTGDRTPAAPLLLTAAGAALVAGGRSLRRRRDETLPVIPRGSSPSGRRGAEEGA